MMGTDFSPFMEAVARELLGEPNARLSKANELRYGKHGSLSIQTEKGTFFDNEAQDGGGTLDLISRETGLDKAGAVEWLIDHGFPVDDNPLPDRSIGARAPTKRAQPARNGNGEHHGDERAPKQERRARPEGVLESEYEYRDERGELLMVVERWRLPEPERKTFRQRDAKGRRSVKGIRAVPYRLQRCLAAIEAGEPIYVFEGEKDVDNVIDALGLAATCNAGGSGKWTEEHAKALAGATLVWVPDNDDAGRGHVQKGAIESRKHVKAQFVLNIPGLGEKEDISDWLDRGGELSEFRALEEHHRRRWTPEPPASAFGSIMFDHLDDVMTNEHAFIIDDFFTAGDLSVVAGPSGSGKSFLTIHAGLTVAYTAVAERDPTHWRERDFFGRRVVEGGLVIYQAGEAARGVKKRIRAWRKEFGIPADLRLPFVLMTKRLDLFRDKDVAPFIAEVKAWQAYYDMPLKMIVVDTFAAAIPGAEENSAKDMTTVLDNCARVRDECGTHVCLVHHMNAAGTKLRGSTAIFAGLDNVITVIKDEANKIRTVSLDKQKDEEDDKGFRFELVRVVLGYDERRRKDITSCVCVEVGAANYQKSAPGFALKDQEREFFDALIQAIQDHGERPSVDLDGCPASIQAVVEFNAFRTVFAKKLWHDDDDDEAKHKERVKKAIERQGKSLTKYGIIGRSPTKPSFLWWTGKPVRGFDKKTMEPPKAKTGALLDRLDDPLAEDREGDLGSSADKE